ncbi:MAG: Gfo/Idh/MocA family oxidoreductase [Gemmatimonadota bacterium]|nr:Gfo/Idh/MocA family oxidoreductase [Gemmatimonadota bacterium]MDH3477800.1 Gfo/Idh/MocA family oxidoreductase [Gemmatimonadota bacterium]MDH3571157.1 Gfo/Idh/MocA family oxidoreductase [Gemmatimonadota bacterium]MDH5549307.1 Gfo/Idh/MocA family oxidoreductase [Gemmatimonadota bacterium]
MTSRRRFVRDSGTVLGAMMVPGVLRARVKRVAPSDQVRVGVIGCNGMGFQNLRSILKIPEVECAALCDVDASVLNRRAGDVEGAAGVRPALHDDFRRLLEDPDIDAVIIGTPDHWHCLMMVMACEAGKDVYVEKPLANSIGECALMVAAAQRYGTVVQAGQWQRSGSHWSDAARYVQSGEIGRIRLVKAWAYQGWMKAIPVKPDEPVPDGVDYDMWLGPAPARPFNPNRFHFNFRWFWDYAGGLMTDWGVHMIDMVHYAMGDAGPRHVAASGGKFAYPDDASETPDTLQATFEFADYSMLWEHATGIDLGPYERNHGVAFIGNRGTVVVDRGKWELLPETEVVEGKLSYLTTPMPVQQRRDDGGLDAHMVNFVECIKTRAQPTCNASVAARAAVTAHLGNIAFKTGRRLTWDDATQSFPGDAQANALLRPTYRAPWRLPSV